jgi:hypothetical protein
MSSSARRPTRAGWKSLAAFLSALMLTAAFGTTVSAGPGNPCPSANCLLVFVNLPNTTETGGPIKDGYDSTGDPISVKIVDKNTGLTVDSDATVTLSLAFNPAGGTLSNGSVAAVAGVATFPDLSINAPGPYTLTASSSVTSNNPVTPQFMVSNTVTECLQVSCSFKQTHTATGNSYTVTPKNGTIGADYVTTLNLPGLKVSCDFAPFNYSDLRQPNTFWYVYDDGGASLKRNVIVIDKAVVQVTPENGASKYRVCYSSPDRFTDRTGNLAPADPWTTPDQNGDIGPTMYFGNTQTWYTGLLPDCANKKDPPPGQAPCVISWTGNSAGDRIGTFVTPPGDPSIR